MGAAGERKLAESDEVGCSSAGYLGSEFGPFESHPTTHYRAVPDSNRMPSSWHGPTTHRCLAPSVKNCPALSGLEWLSLHHAHSFAMVYCPVVMRVHWEHSEGPSQSCLGCEHWDSGHWHRTSASAATQASSTLQVLAEAAFRY